MAQMQKIKQKLSNIKNAINLSQSMLMNAKLKMNVYYNEYRILKHQITELGKLAHYNKINFDTNIQQKCFVFSDGGFCGLFNDFKTGISGSDLVIGKRGIKFNKNVIALLDEIQFINYIMHNKINDNIEFYVNSFESKSIIPLNFNSFIKQSDKRRQYYFIDIDHSDFKALYQKTFIRYIRVLGLLTENMNRAQIMNNSVENGKQIYDETFLVFNKARQEKITNEICLIMSGKEALDAG